MDDYSNVIYWMRDRLQLICKDDNDALFSTAAAMGLFNETNVRKVNLYKSIAANNVIPISFCMRQCETFSLSHKIHCIAIRC